MPKRRDELISAYIAGLDLTVICITAQPGGRATFEMVPWPGPPKPVASFVFAKPGHAELVMAKCASAATAIDVALRTFHEAVAAVGAHWRSADDIHKMAAADIDEIEQHIKVLNRAGGLSHFNQAYKKYRQLCVSLSTPATSYSTYLHGFMLKIADLVGKNVASGANKFEGVASVRLSGLPGRSEKYNDLPKTGRPVIPGWTHPNRFPRRKAQA